MAPKPPISSIPKINLPELPTTTPPRLQADASLPGTRMNTGLESMQPAAGWPDGTPHAPGLTPGLLPDVPQPIQTQALAGSTVPTRPLGNDPLNGFRVSVYSANTLPPPNDAGLRIHAQRMYADIPGNGTVQVSYDAGTNTYRAQRRFEVTPSGPVLHLNNDGKSWSLDPPAPPPVNMSTTAIAPRIYLDSTHYVWNPDATNLQGYVVLHRKRGLDAHVGPETHMAFQDDNGSFVKVEPGSTPIDQPAAKLAAWTDRDLWDMYDLSGSDITRFRDEVTVTGMKPQWASIRQERLQKSYLLDELRRWLAPHMSRDEFNRRMEPLNYSVEQWAAQLDRVSLDSVARRQREVHKRKLANPQAQTGAEAKRPRLADEQSPTADSPAVPDYITKSVEYGALRDQLIEQLRSLTSTGPAAKSREEITRQIQPYNLSTRQLSRLVSDVQAQGRIPQWAEDLRHSSMDETNPHRFDEVYEELLPEILHLRNQSTGNIAFSDNFTRPYLNALLTKAGYQRNKYNCLYRTDIPAMFRGDDRNPFEFFEDHMRPRQKHGVGSTTQKAVSATFSLSEAYVHARSAPEVEALLYDTQHHKYPGELIDYSGTRRYEERGKSSSSSDDSSSSSDDSSLSSDDSSSSSDEDSSGNPLLRFHDKHYIAKRQNQRIGFTYLLDTRNIEVVPGEENLAFNAYARTEKKPGEKIWFPDDSYEGHISMSARGLSADRIWLINSNGTRAAKINDICALYLRQPESARHRPRAGRPIEERTWSGDHNEWEYDDLIDQAANLGKPVIKLPDGEIYSNDIVFP
ncbi:hypothetical protein [Pseudomonas sp. BF-B-26]|uniref:hypothetical protein n=1 Tax=Pseudomonas sp. BF-B-26 TaxID=2832400 RepID=UPI001CBE073C|nr:hypothetical protein [Pseudomonas sp. BF-B-26]